MNKKIWIFNHYATSMFKNKGGRHYWFADNLYKNGYIPTVFCSDQYHENTESIDLKGKKYIEIKTETATEDGSCPFPFVFVKSSPYKGNGFARVKNMFSFANNLRSVTKIYAEQNGTPDIILASSVHPLTLIAGILIAKRYKIPCICEIRDLWPESIFEYSSLKKNSFTGKLLRTGEKWIYKKADRIIFTKPGDYDYIIEQKWQDSIKKEKCFYINNGVDLDNFDYNKENFIINDEDLENDGIFKVIYTGSVRKVNNLEIFISAAKQLKDNKEIKFLIWGAGNELEALKERAAGEKLQNIVFKGYVGKQYVPYILSKASVNISHYKYTPILRFGTSQNKDFEYLASGKPIIRTIKSGYDFIAEANAGRCVEDQTAENIKNTVIDMYTIFAGDKNLYEAMCINARNLAENYDFKVLTGKLIEIIERL